VNRLRERAERLRLFVKKMVEGSILCSNAGANSGYLYNRKWFNRAIKMLKAPYSLNTEIANKPINTN
jgi:NADH:ubiquinone oxidoreductase subunit F (NADH-binding)